METNNLHEQIEKMGSEDDIDGLISLINTLDQASLQQHKEVLLNECQNVFFYWLNTLYLDKIKKEDQQSVVDVLLELHEAMEKLEPQFLLMGEICLYLYTTATDKQLLYIQKAIDSYTEGLTTHATPELHNRLADALLTRMELTQQHSDQELTEILHHFQSAFITWSQPIMFTFLQACSRVKPFSEAWHQRFTNAFDAALANFAKADAYVYLEYLNALMRGAGSLTPRAIALLEGLKDYDTQNQERLNQLGMAFENLATLAEDDASQLNHYEAALCFFKKGQSINPAAWTFPVYATNVLMAMARIEPTSAIDRFEEGRKLFTITCQYEKGFTLLLHWGDFLIEYGRLVPEMLKEAEEKLLKAKDLGENYYDHPYRSLAKVALKLGDKQRCLDILQECKATFSTNYYEYEHSIVLEDEDFREIWDDLRH